MKYRFFSPLTLCGLLLFSTQAISQKLSQKDIQFARLSQKELNSLAEKIAANGMHQYTYRVFTFDNKHVAKLDKERTVRGLFLLRKPEFMNPLHNGFFDDQQGNLIYFGHFRGKQNKDVSYAVTFAAIGVVDVAFDADRDGLMDGMIGWSPDGQFWSLSDNASLALRECFEGRAFGDTTLCVRGGNSGQGRGGAGRPTKTGSGSTPDVAEDADSFEAFINGLEQPDCDDVKNPEGLVRDEQEKKEIADLEKTRDILRERAAREREAHHESTARQIEEALGHLQDAIDTFKESRDRDASPAEREAAQEVYAAEVRLYNAALSRLGFAGHDLPYRSPMPLHPTMIRHGRVHLGGGTYRPAGPDGKTEDPRCASVEAEIRQGLWFMDKKFCPDRNFLDCWERSTDAIRDATDGRCHTETGKDDSRALVCERNEPRPTEPRDSDNPSGPADDPVRFPIAPGPRVDYTLPVPGPFGALMAVFCQQVDRCPGMKGLKEAKPPIQP